MFLLPSRRLRLLLCLPVGGLLSLILAPAASAQKAWSFVLAPQMHVTRYVFAGHDPVSPRLLLRPNTGFAATVGLRYGLAQQLSLEGGIGPRSDGVKIVSVADYAARRRFESVKVATMRFNSPQVHLVLLYRSQPSETGHVWLAEGGIDVISRRYLNIGQFTSDLSTNSGQPASTLTGTSQWRGRSELRPGFRVGLGREWQLRPRQFVGIKLLGSVGLHEFSRFQLRYSFSEGGATKTYQNTIYTKLGYIGVHSWYRLQL